LSVRGAGDEGGGPERQPLLVTLLNYSEKVVYYGAAFALLVTIVMLFVSVGTALLAIFETGPLDTALLVLDRVLLIFIFVELLDTIGIFVREHEIIAEPFLLIGLIAVVRRILLVTAEAEQTIGTAEFPNLILELGVLTALVVSLSFALYFTRRTSGRRSRHSD
jgi:uncharacterized membrane protein (DUF373 family)